MFTIERIQRIRKILLEKKRIEVTELSRIFNLSESTIRRDLDKLENEGFLQKTYGGAVLANGSDHSGDQTDPDDEWDKIARTAAEMVADNDAVYLGGGPIGLRLAGHLAHNQQRCTIITNDLEVAFELAEAAGVFVKMSGGDLIPGTTSLAGPDAITSLRGICLNRAFLTPAGADLKFGYTAGSQNEALLLRTVLEITQEPVVLADHLLFGKVALSPIVELEKLPVVVSSNLIPPQYKTFFYENGVQLFTAFEIVHPN